MKNLTEKEILKLMDEINYGWVDKNNNIHYEDFERMDELYILQTPKEVIKNKVGLCWDQVELERYYFESNNYDIKTFFICYHDNNKFFTHTFLTYEKNNKIFWFEHSWEECRGIHEYSSFQELLVDIKSKFLKAHENIKLENLKVYEYQQPLKHISASEFIDHCVKSRKVY